MGCCFVLSAIRHQKVIHVNFFVFFSILAGPGRFLLRSRKVATIAAWRNDFSSLLANVLKPFLVAERQVSAVLNYVLVTKRYWTRCRWQITGSHQSRWLMWEGYISKFLQRLFGFWLSLVLKEIMVPGRSFNLVASKCLYKSVVDQGKGPPYFWTKLWPEGPKKNFFPPPHSNNLSVWMTPPPLIWRSGSADAGTLQGQSNFPITIVASVASGISRLNQPTYIISPKV